MELSKERIESLRELLAPANRKIVIVAHTNPDGDAVGSSLAWAEVLRGMGHEVTCIVPNKYPYFLDWMQGIEEVVVFKNDTEGRAARAIVRCSQNLIEGGKRLFPAGLRRWVGTRFNTNEVELQDDKAAFDVVRESLVL